MWKAGHYSGSAQRDFFKRAAEVCLAGTLHVQLPCQQGGRTVGAICSQSIHLGSLIKGVQSEVVSWPQPGTVVQFRVWDTDCCEGNGLGNVHLKLSEARLIPLPWCNLWEGKIEPNPHLLQELRRSAKPTRQAKQPARGISTTVRQQDKCLKGPILNSPQGDKYSGS